MNQEKYFCDVINGIISGRVIAIDTNLPEMEEILLDVGRDWNRNIKVNGKMAF